MRATVRHRLGTFMKRLALTLALACAAYAAVAQAPFTISRPADGSRVRETIRVLIPKNSVPPNGYIGIFIGGKFVEATIPPLDPTKKYYEYDLDTKAKGIPDGKLTLEAVLYVDYQQSARIVDRTSVEVTVQNTANAKIPDDGLLLRYKWTPGTQMIYDMTERRIVDTGEEKLIKLGAKPAETSSELLKVRMLYACDNAYADGSGLVRMQALPEKGKDSAFLITSLDPNGRRYMDYEMHPIYQRISGTGNEVWGSIPFATPIEGTSGEAQQTDLFADFPLPSLPAKRIKLGGPGWASRFQFGAIDLDNAFTSDTEVVRLPARGELVGLEWEMGHPCAKIVNTIAVGDAAVKKAEEKVDQTRNAAMVGIGEGVELKETVWFALDRRQIVKIVRTITSNEVTSTPNGTSGAPGMPGMPGVPGRPGMPGSIGFPGNRGGGGEQGTSDILPPPATDYQFPPKGGKGMQPGMPGVPGGFQGPGSQFGRPGFGRQGTGMTGAPASTSFTRVTREFTFVLEQ